MDGAFGRSFEADKSANQGVIARVRRVGIGLPKLFIEPSFGRTERMIRDRNSQSAEAWPADGHQESLWGLNPHPEVLDPFTDQITPWKYPVIHNHQYTLLLADVPGMESELR